MSLTITMASHICAALAGGALMLSATTTMAVDTWGTGATAFNFNCQFPGCSGGGVGGGDSMFPPDVEGYQSNSATNSVAGSLGTSSITARLVDSGSGFTTMLQTGEATSTAVGIAGGTGHALEFYTYSGPSTTITITIMLSGTAVGPLAGADNSLDGITAGVYLYNTPASIADVDNHGSPFTAFCNFISCFPDQLSFLSIHDSSSSESTTLVLPLEDGDVFYLYGFFSIGAAGRGSVSGATFAWSFSDATGLTSLGAGGGAPDTDGDGIGDDADNCTLLPNADQRDTDADGFGNACDVDLNNDCIVNAVDLGLFRLVFFTGDPDSDFNGDGVVNVIDLGVLKSRFFASPGPSGLPNACDGR